MRALIAAALLLSSAIATAQEAPATDDSIRELIEVSGAARLLDGMRPQLEAAMERGLQQALKDKTLTIEQTRVLDDMRERFLAVFMETMNWPKLELVFIDIYRRSFSQVEVDGMIAFYRTDIGQALIAKMPVVMEHTMTAMQQHLLELMPKIEAIQKDTLARLKALEGPGP